MPALPRDNTFSLTIAACAYPVQVLAFSGDEAISSPFSFDVELVCDRADLDLEALLHTPAFLGLISRAMASTGRFIASFNTAPASA